MQQRSTTPLVIGAVVVLVAVVALVAVLVSGSGDGDDATGSSSPTSASGSSGPTSAYGIVTVEGAPLPRGEAPDDPSVGDTVPTLRGEDYAGASTAIVPGQDGPLMIVVMAHWCPHCNNEVPKLIEWGASGAVPDGLQVVGVSTAASDEAPNFPPGEWLQDLGWDWPVIADDADQTAAQALGVTGYPFIMFVDATGDLMFRVAAELPIDDIQRLADAAAATA
ncbi:MAG: TlpA disulfide reductase family protein [Ilumatobacteraceae bacterium]